MGTPQQDRVRDRAYQLWQESGGEPGREMDHWLRAEREVSKGEISAGSAREGVPPKKAKVAAPAPKAAVKASGPEAAAKPKAARAAKTKA